MPYIQIQATREGVTKEQKRQLIAGATNFVVGAIADDEGVLAVIDAYCQGIYRGDIELLRSAFDPKAALFGEVRGEPYYRLLDDYLDVVAKRTSPQALGEPFRMAPLAVEVTGNIAFAKIHCPIFDYNYTDYLSLVRQEGKWRIVSKLFTDLPVA